MKIQHTESRSGDTVGMKCKEEKCEISARRLKRKIEEGPARRVKSSGERERESAVSLVLVLLWPKFSEQQVGLYCLPPPEIYPHKHTHINTRTHFSFGASFLSPAVMVLICTPNPRHLPLHQSY